MELEDRARDCLLTLLTSRGEAFIQMMLLDACFIIEFLQKCYLQELRDKDDPIIRTSWIKIPICCDLMLLENQLPFFVLLQLFNMSETSSNPSPPFAKLAETPLLQPSSFYYSQVCQKLNDHCKKSWNKARAKLRRDYFYSPWAAVSTIAAVFLLLLTFSQTMASLIPLFG
ncbi:uncharacterized protein LOC130765702 [Actinidia eriantha]|uniref:uncharacterized protein LOC130765702 n=1 Tax=Actinidia eriantha TaxID=165200 RepID=UPI002583B9E9|nr:uncharacterized protein LOC130765702 [Actinidia eriantha]